MSLITVGKLITMTFSFHVGESDLSYALEDSAALILMTHQGVVSQWQAEYACNGMMNS